MQTLTVLPLRPDGVRGTLELVFSVHPSNVGKTDPSSGQEAQKQGASITHEAVAVATKLVSSVPAGMTPDAWFSGISDQIFGLMDGTAGPDLARTAAQIVGYGILGKKIHGAPGSAGWAVFVQPLIEAVNPTLKRDTGIKKENEDGDVIDLSKPKILVAAEKLQEAIHRLEVLVLSNPSPGLCKRILGRIILQIWALASWNNPSDTIQKSVYTPAKRLLRTYLQLFGNLESVKPLIGNLTCKGSSLVSVSTTSTSDTAWQFTTNATGAVEIIAVPPPDASQPELDWMDIEYRATTLAEYISNACSAEDTSMIFLSLLRRWVETAGKPQGGKIELLSPVKPEVESPIEDLMEVSVLQQLMEKAPEKLISHFDQLLELITQVFEADAKSPLGDDVIGIVLSLLNLAVTAPTFQKSDINPRELQVVEASLDRLAGEGRGDVSATARNLGLLLKYRDELDDPDDKGKGPPDARKLEDRKTYNLAMSYITGDKDNPPPIIAEGLKLLSGLITAESPILDITAITVLLANLLKENEDYINLQVVKMFTQLANKHPKTTLKELLDNYLDAQEKATTDTRLRFGEALVQVIERLGQTFTGEAAQQAGETLLSIAGRRGYRPKTLAKQAKEERMRKLKAEKRARQEAAGITPPPGDEDDDDDDDVDMPDLDVDGKPLTEEAKERNDVLAQIIQGWESKRGSEDIRMRTSALSILGTALETSIRGVGATIASASVDLCLNVLTLEPELEKGILRRAAIVVILSFVRALAAAKEEQQSSFGSGGGGLGFGLTEESRVDIQRSLEYIAATDNDGLVREHARDVVESLEAWRMTSLLPHPSANDAGSAGDGALNRLAGLQVNPDVTGGGGQRPRIEEIE